MCTLGLLKHPLNADVHMMTGIVGRSATSGQSGHGSTRSSQDLTMMAGTTLELTVDRP